MTATSLIALVPNLVRQTLEVDSIGKGLPLKVEQRVDGLDLNPPGPPLHRFPNEPRVIARSNNVLVAVLNVGIFERNLRN